MFQGLSTIGLFADDIVTAYAESEADVGVVQVVGRADAHIVQLSFLCRFGAFRCGGRSARIRRRKLASGKVAVDDAHGIEGIEGGDEAVAGFADGFHVPRGDIAGGAYECEVFHNGSRQIYLPG
jgi:hypothetical protein